MNATSIFNGFYISGEPKCSEVNGRKRIEFSICSPQKYYNGQYLKIYCCAFDEQALMIERLKAKKGSLVNVVCEMSPYDREGKQGISYKILGFSYSAEAPAKEKETVKKTKEEAVYTAAKLLAENPFS